MRVIIIIPGPKGEGVVTQLERIYDWHRAPSTDKSLRPILLDYKQRRGIGREEIESLLILVSTLHKMASHCVDSC